MSPITVHAPSSDLLPDLRKDQRIEPRVLPDTPLFRCPHCQAITAFEAYYPKVPDPVLPERAAFDKASHALRSRGCHHRDFACQGCGRAVRVVYGAFEFVMSSYLFIPEQVLVGGPRP